MLLELSRGRLVGGRRYAAVPAQAEVDPTGAGDTMLAGVVAARVAGGAEDARERPRPAARGARGKPARRGSGSRLRAHAGRAAGSPPHRYFAPKLRAASLSSRPRERSATQAAISVSRTMRCCRADSVRASAMRCASTPSLRGARARPTPGRDVDESDHLVAVGVVPTVEEDAPRRTRRWGYAGLQGAQRHAWPDTDADAITRSEDFRARTSWPSGS